MGLLDGKVAIVTGAGHGIGRGHAMELAKHGARVVVNDLGGSVSGEGVGRDADLTVDIITARGGEAVANYENVADFEGAGRMVAQAVDTWGRLDILVNNAGINIRKQPQEYTSAEWHQVLDSNLTSAFLCSQSAYPAMMKTGGGKMINIGSMMSIFGASFTTAYAASKGGIVQMTKAMATAWAKDNIQVNVILPGWIDTALTQRARRDVPALHDSVLKRTPAGRWGTPDDFAGIAVFLASSASDYVTGAAITVDGGYSVQG